MTDAHATTARLDAAADRADRRLEALARQDRALSRVRVALGAALALALAAVFTSDAGAVQSASVATALALAVAFAVAARRHGQLDRAARRWRAWRQVRLDRRARLLRDWARVPPPLALSAPPSHPFGADLQTLGPRSLHHLVDSAGTDGGRRRLAEWMLTTEPDADAVSTRASLVAELVPAAGFRDRVALAARLAGGAGRAETGARRLEALLDGPDRTAALRRALAVSFGVIAVTLALLVGWIADAVPPVFIFGYLAYALVYVFLFGELSESFEDADTLERSLGTLADLFAVAETRTPRGARLEALLAPFAPGPASPSAVLRRLRRVVTALAVKQNGLVWLAVNAFFPWDVWFALRLARLRRDASATLPAWVDAWATLEAASSLAEFADLNGAPFPRVAAGALAFRGAGMVHPLLPPGAAVPNSFAFDAPGEIAIVTGSNMSGKSTFLRTLGSNLILAYAGGPVMAEAVAAAPMRLHAVLNVADSVQDGISYFYAEVRRLKGLLDAVEAPDERPVFSSSTRSCAAPPTASGSRAAAPSSRRSRRAAAPSVSSRRTTSTSRASTVTRSATSTSATRRTATA